MVKRKICVLFLSDFKRLHTVRIVLTTIQKSITLNNSFTISLKKQWVRVIT